MSDKKKYVVTAITLGLIAAGSAALIGVTNLVTRERIAQNEKNKINAGIVEIFGENASIWSSDEVENHKYVKEAYTVGINGYASAFAYKTTGSNAYGKISMIVGFDHDCKFAGVYMINDEQTYASTLEDNYITSINGGGSIDDVKCGATYGATLVKEMIADAQSCVDSIIWD